MHKCDWNFERDKIERNKDSKYGDIVPNRSIINTNNVSFSISFLSKFTYIKRHKYRIMKWDYIYVGVREELHIMRIGRIDNGWI